jgi:hypothetical protein
MEKLLTWKCVSDHSYLWKERKKMIKPGQIFTALEKDLPKELQTMVIPVSSTSSVDAPVAQRIYDRVVNFVKPSEPIEIPKTEEPKPPVGSTYYRLKERNGGEYWDVLDSNGKIVNEQQLTKEDAIEMIRSLRT